MSSLAFRDNGGGSVETRFACPEILHRDYKNLVFYILRNSQLPSDICEDIFSEVFLKITSGSTGLRHTRNLKAWVVAITRNEIANHLNQQIRRNLHLSSPQLKLFLYDSSEKNCFRKPFTQEKALLQKEIHCHISRHLRTMDIKFAKPFMLRHLEGKRWDEIGELLLIKEDTARKRADKARKLLKMGVAHLLSPGFQLN